WFKGATLLPGETNTSLFVPDVSAASAGTYKVVVTGSCGTPVTNSATLSIIPPPVITCPSNRTVEIIAPWAFDQPMANYPIVVLECPTEPSTNITGVATATDAESQITVTYSDSVSNICGAAKVITRTWRATDGCSNSASCTQIITIRDITRPTLSCPGDV